MRRYFLGGVSLLAGLTPSHKVTILDVRSTRDSVESIGTARRAVGDSGYWRLTIAGVELPGVFRLFEGEFLAVGPA